MMNYNPCKHNLVKYGVVWILYNNTNIQNSEIRIVNISGKPVLIVNVNHKVPKLVELYFIFDLRVFYPLGKLHVIL